MNIEQVGDVESMMVKPLHSNKVTLPVGHAPEKGKGTMIRTTREMLLDGVNALLLRSVLDFTKAGAQQ